MHCKDAQIEHSVSKIRSMNQLGGDQEEAMVHFTSEGVCSGMFSCLEEAGFSLFRPSAWLGKHAMFAHKGDVD